MKTISHQGQRYEVVYLHGSGVVVEIPPKARWGMYSRMTIPLKELTSRQRKNVLRTLGTV